MHALQGASPFNIFNAQLLGSPTMAQCSHLAGRQKQPRGAGRAQGIFAAVLIHAVFFLSGVPALIYQVLWQRALFVIFGVDILSTTAVVSAFLLGLGLGSLIGGELSRSYQRLALLF